MELSSLTSEQYRKLETAELMRVLSAKAHAQGGSAASAAEYYQQRWGTSPTASIVIKAFEWERKAAVAPGNTTDSAWAAPLVTSRIASGFLALLRQTSVIGRLPGIMMVPFNTKLPYQISGASMKWVGENSPKPATKLGLGSLTLTPTKASGIIVVSAELMKLSAPGSEDALKQILANELVAFTDAAFLSAAAATASSPAGILNGVTVSASIAATISALFTARPSAISPTWITSPANIGTLSALDQRMPETLKGYPVVTSPAAGVNLILADAAAIAVADDGVELDVSDQALVEMNDAAAPATAATLYTSLWQENLAGIRAERFLNWKAAAGAVQFTATLT